MLVFGGVDAQGETLNDLWALRLPSLTWALLRPLDTSILAPYFSRSRHSAVPLPPPATDLLLFGGLSGDKVRLIMLYGSSYAFLRRHYVGNPRSEEKKTEFRFFLAQFMNPCT